MMASSEVAVPSRRLSRKGFNLVNGAVSAPLLIALF
jgi:hypothetical protein